MLITEICPLMFRENCPGERGGGEWAVKQAKIYISGLRETSCVLVCFNQSVEYKSVRESKCDICDHFFFFKYMLMS